MSLSRQFNWAILLSGLMLQAGIHAASAQELIPINLAQDDFRKPPKNLVLDLTLKSRQVYQMSTKEVLKKVENSDSKVLFVKSLEGEKRFSEVLFEALATGTATVTLTDIKGNVETVEVTVVDEERARKLEILLRRVVPTGSITVTPVGQTGVVLTGHVLTVEDGRVVQQMAEKMFPAASIVVQGSAQTQGALRPQTNVINNIKIGGVQQVQLEVIVAVVNRSKARNMAFSFNANGSNWFVSSLIGGNGGLASALAAAPGATTSTLTGTGSANLPFGVLNTNNSFMGFLQALRNDGLAKIYAEPRVTTLSGRPGKIQSGGNVQIISSGVSSSQISADFGTIVNFLPVVLGNGKIHLEVSAEVSTPTTSIPIPGAGAAGTVSFSVLKRSAQVAVQIDDGQTLAIGGLIQNNVDASIQRVPVLGDLPFIGTAFTSKSYIEKEEELIILVTPRLVDPVDCCKIPRYLPGRETRNPDDYELFLEGIIEAPRGPRNVQFPHYRAAHLNAPDNGIPCGDGNCNLRGGNCANGSCGVPSFPIGVTTPRESVSMPPSSGRAPIEPRASTPMPMGRDQAPNLGPAVPIAPSRPLETRTNLPPVSFGPGRSD